MTWADEEEYLTTGRLLHEATAERLENAIAENADLRNKLNALRTAAERIGVALVRDANREGPEGLGWLQSDEYAAVTALLVEARIDGPTSPDA